MIRDSLAITDEETLEHELIDLTVWQYCRPLLHRSEDDD